MLKRLPALFIVMVASAVVTTAQPGAATVGKDVTVLGFKLHYLEAGRGAPVVLLHGLGGDGSRWKPNIEPLAKDFHVFALDQIGFGQSDKPLANYHTGMLAEFLVDFLKATHLGRASLVGNSMGAGVALYAAVRYPEMVDRIVLADGGGYRQDGRAEGAGGSCRTASRATRRASFSRSCFTTRAWSPTRWWRISTRCACDRRSRSRRCRRRARRVSAA